MNPLTTSDIEKIFCDAGLREGSHCCLQSSFKGTGVLKDGPQSIAEAFLSATGASGTAIMPAYNFHSWTQSHYFDSSETPSEVGAVTELFRTLPGVRRTKHPIHSLSVAGALRDELCAMDAENSFGGDSVFARLLAHDITYMTIGTGLAMPFLPCHYTEKMAAVNYRREKLFAGLYFGEDRVPVLRRYGFDVRKDAFSKGPAPVYELHIELHRRGIVRMENYAGVVICSAGARAYHEAATEFIRENPALFGN